MEKIFKVGTRTSPLALAQVGEFCNMMKKHFSDFDLKIVGFETKGDKDRRTPLTDTEGSDFFTDAIDDALKAGAIDISLHSAKDLPEKVDESFFLAALTESIDPQDVLVSKKHETLDKLKSGSRIGTSSRNRSESINRYRPDLVTVSIRGNVDERVRMVREGRIDAVILAAAGLIRLGLEKEISQRIPLDIISPHPMQGKLAVLIKKDNIELAGMLEAIDGR